MRRRLWQAHEVGVIARHVAKHLTPVAPQVLWRGVLSKYVAQVVVHVPSSALAKSVGEVAHDLREAIGHVAWQQRAEPDRRDKGPLLPPWRCFLTGSFGGLIVFECPHRVERQPLVGEPADKALERC